MRARDGNRLWTYDGEVWGVWRLTPPAWRRMPRRTKLAWHRRTSALLSAIEGEWSLCGLSSLVSPSVVASAMIEGVDLGRCVAWRHHVLSALDDLEQTPLVERSHWLAVRLSTPGSLNASVQAALGSVGRIFGLTTPPPTGAERKAAQKAAADLHQSIAAAVGCAREATEAEVGWIYARTLLRHSAAEPLVEEIGSGSGSLRHLVDARLTEGSEEKGTAIGRYVRVDTEGHTCWQTSAVVADAPESWIYPDGGGLLARLDEMPFGVDWTLRAQATPNSEAQAQVRRKLRELRGQDEEYAGDPSGAPPSLADSLTIAEAEWAELAATPGVPSLRCALILGIGADDRDDLEQRAEILRNALEANEFTLPRPTGEQIRLLAAQMPGTRWGPVLSDAAQTMFPSDAAGLAPLAGTTIGDPYGAFLGRNIDSGSPVLFDPSNGPKLPPPHGPRSGSLAIVGALGGGKSETLKVISLQTLARGGRVVVTVDRTPMGEWVRLADVVDGTHQVVTLGPGTTVCLDPLRVFSGEDAVSIATGFLTLLCGVAPTDPTGAAIAEAVRVVASRGGRLIDVVDVLEGTEDHQAARQIRVFSAGAGLSRVVFGDGETLRLDADYLVFHAPHLDLPDRETMADPHRHLLVDQVFSQALMYLVAAVARRVAFEDPDRFALVVQDEGYVLTSSTQGRSLLLGLVRDGRKHNAALAFASHHPSDLGDPNLEKLMGTRFAFRVSRSAAPEVLGFLGLEVTPDTLAAISEEERGVGECLMATGDGQVGLVAVAEPSTPEQRAAVRTDAGAGPAAVTRRPRLDL